MDKTVLSVDDLIVESFTTAADMSVIGVLPSGCIGPCEPQFSQGFC